MAFCVVVTNVVNPGAFSLKMVVFWLRLTTFVTSAAHWSPGQAPPPPINFARNSPVVCSIIEFALLELQRFWGVSKNDHDKLRAKCGGGGVVAARGHRQPGPVGQAACLCETPVAFAGAGRALSETGIAFAGAGRASTETGIAFAGEKWVFLAHFSVALVLSVSMVAVQGRAVVMVVSMSPRCCASWAKKFALRAQNGPKLACCGVLGEFFRGPAVVGTRRASLLRRTPGSRTHLLAVLTLQCAAKPT